MVEFGDNVKVAFGLVLGASLSTTLGASAVFFPRLVNLATTRVLASALAIAGGVMIYVSLIEIFQKANSSFVDAGHPEGMSKFYTTICFFGGMLIMLVVDYIVKLIGGNDHHESSTTGKQNVAPHCVGCSEDPVAELQEWQAKAREERNRESDTYGCSIDAELDDSDEENRNVANNGEKKESESVEITIGDGIETEVDEEKTEKDKLIQMGVATAIAISLHNFPEGLATFVASLDDPSVGVVLAVALGLHNIPEGLCVALPIYYATGNRMKAFLWGAFSGLSELIGALLGWLVLGNVMVDEVYGVLFGLVAGMMTLITLRELIPTAFRYDPKDTVVTYSTIAGMAVMAASLVLFDSSSHDHSSHDHDLEH